MIKRVPYNDKLIPIGNAPVYAGKPVYTDGQVAYGWTYSPQQKNPLGLPDTSGFWVGSEFYNGYQLAKRNLQLGELIAGHAHGDLQCYPCWASIENITVSPPHYGFLHTPTGVYDFYGAVVAMDSNGTIITYDDFYLYWYSKGSRRKDNNDNDLYRAKVQIMGVDSNDNWFLLDTGTYYSTTTNNNTTIVNIYEADTRQAGVEPTLKKIATYSDGQVIYGEVGDPDYYNGQGEIDIRDKYPLYRANIVPLSLDELRYIPGGAIINYDDFWDGQGTQPYVVIGSTLSTDEARYAFQLSNTSELWALAETPDRTTGGDIIYSGYYSVIMPNSSISGSGHIVVDSNNETWVYDASTGDEIAHTNGNDVYYFDNTGTLIYSGSGSINTSNLSPVTSQKYYKIEKTGITEVASFPNTWNIGNGAELSLPTMDVSFTDSEGQTHTYTGDPLGVLNPQQSFISHPGGVFSYNDFVISQDSHTIFHFDTQGQSQTPQSEEYIGLLDCFSLAWLRNKWR